MFYLARMPLRHNGCVYIRLGTALVAFASVAACLPSARPPSAITTATQNDSEPLKSASSTGPVLSDLNSTPAAPTAAPASVPPVWTYIADNFEGGSLARWGEVSPSDLKLSSGAGHDGSTGLSVAVHTGESYLYDSDIVKTNEGYAAFWFNPNNVEIPDEAEVPIPGKSIRIVDVKGYQHYDLIVGLRIWKPSNSGEGYRAYLEWQAPDGDHFDIAAGQFDLANGWQQIAVGFRTNEWIAVWVNGVLARKVTGIQQSEAFGQQVEFGKANDDSVTIPSGSMLYDDVAFEIPRIVDLWVDTVGGSDGNTGRQPNAAFRTIQRAADAAGPGTVVHILPGIYRESIHPTVDGTVEDPIIYRAEAGPGTVIIRGSVASNTLSWHPLQSNTIGLPTGVDPSQIYSADLSALRLSQTPRFLAEVGEQGAVMERLPLAREPDWSVQTDWKSQELWWSADGGSVKAGCNPATDPNPNCDMSSRSLTMLTDSTDDPGPQGIEPGNLSTLRDLTGATLVAIDAQEGHYVYRRTIISDDVGSGRITVDRSCAFDHDTQNPGLGWGTKYYVEGKPSLLDTPGEWWYDTGTGHLYLWPPSAQSPANLDIEISVENNGFDLSDRSNIIVDGLTLEFFNGSAIYGSNDSGEKSANNRVKNVTLRYADNGVELSQSVGDNPQNITSRFTLEHSDIGQMDTNAIRLSYTWKDESAPSSFTFPGITDTLILDNQLHDLGFRSDQDNANGISFEHADQLRFISNHVYNVAHNGVQFSWSIVQSDKAYGFTPEEIKTGGILVQDNIFEQACQLTSDCAGLKFWGDPPYQHVYRDVLITGNIFRDTLGWSSVSEERGRWTGGPGSAVRGMGGFGLYIDMASGFHIYRNIAYKNAFAGMAFSGAWRDGDMVVYNNTLANSLYGLLMRGLEFGTHGNVNTQIANNMIVDNEADGLWLDDPEGAPGEAKIDYNLYFRNGWRPDQSGGVVQPGDLIVRRTNTAFDTYATIAAIQADTPWEAHGVEGNPAFASYNPDDHNRFDGSWPDFHLTGASTIAIGHGTTDLPVSLSSLLTEFKLTDVRAGPAFDIGRFEAEPTAVTSTPQATSWAGGTYWPLPAAFVLASLFLPARSWQPGRTSGITHARDSSPDMRDSVPPFSGLPSRVCGLKRRIQTHPLLEKPHDCQN